MGQSILQDEEFSPLRKVTWFSSLSCMFYNFSFNCKSCLASIQVHPAGVQSIPGDKAFSSSGKSFMTTISCMILQLSFNCICCLSSMQVPPASIEVLGWWIEVRILWSENTSCRQGSDRLWIFWCPFLHWFWFCTCSTDSIVFQVWPPFPSECVCKRQTDHNIMDSWQGIIITFY